MSLEVLYIDAPRGAQGAGTSESQNGQPFSSDVLQQSSDIPYATLEDGGWPLNGSRMTLPDNPQNIGWWSREMTDRDGHFPVNPKITITFPTAYTASGLTFTFAPSTNQWCTEIKVTWYSSRTQIRSTVYHPDAPRWLLEELVEGFDRIVIEIMRTSRPHQFAKIQNIMVGQTIRFGKGEIISANVVSEADHKLCELTVDTMRLEIHDRKKRKLLPQEKQKVALYQNGTLIACDYINSSIRETPYFYTMSCQSAISLLEDSFLGGLYSGVPIKTALDSIFGEIPYQLAGVFSSEKITGYLPVCTRREALQQVAFAIGAVVKTHGSETVRLEVPESAISYSFGREDIFVGAKVETGKRYARVTVASHTYTKSSETEDLVSDEYISGTDILFTFDQPHYDYTITGGSISSSGDNWVRVTANGNVSISAKTYIHSSSMRSRRNSFATENEQSNVITVDSATLVTSENVETVLNRLYDASLLRFMLKQDAVIRGQTCGDKVSSINPWNTQTRGFITAMSSDYTQTGHTAQITICGVEVETEGIYPYSGELYSGEKEALY